jgi:hypothetical protein
MSTDYVAIVASTCTHQCRSIAPPLVPGGTTVVHLLPSHLLIYHRMQFHFSVNWFSSFLQCRFSVFSYVISRLIICSMKGFYCLLIYHSIICFKGSIF